MASQGGTPLDAVSLLFELARAPFEFDFHMALRRLECAYRDAPRWGEATRPEEEPVRFGQEPSLEFQPATLVKFQPEPGARGGRLLVGFFGLFGPQGPLPLHLTEYARERLRNVGDRTFTSFADIFHHRMLALFHRAWARSQPTVSHDRPEQDRFASYIGSLAGLALDSLRRRDGIPDRAKLQYTAWLASPARNRDGLRAMVSHYFESDTVIEEWQGTWVNLPESGRFRLGFSRDVSTVARTTILGPRVWQRAHKFRIVLGPLSRDRFESMLPGSASLARLVDLVRLYVADELDWDVRLVLAPDASDQITLGRAGRLGWNSRLGEGRQKEDLVVNPFTHQTHRWSPGAAS